MARQKEKLSPGFYESLIARHGTDSVIVTDHAGKTVWVNSAFTQMSGYGIDDMKGRRPGDILQGPDTDPATILKVSDALKRRQSLSAEILNYTKHGEPYWIEMNITPIFDDAGKHTHFLSIEREVTERRALETKNAEVMELERQRERERSLLGQVNEWLYSAKSMDELLQVARKSMATLLPEAEGSLYIYSDDRDTLEVASVWGDTRSIDPITPDECWALRRGRAYSFGTRAIEFACAHVANEDHPFFCLPIVADGETIGMLHVRFTAFHLRGLNRVSLETFIEKRWLLCLLCAEQMSLAIANVRLRQMLLDQSVRDPLTRLWNRRWLRETTERMIAQARSGEIELSIVACDIDEFKQINDRFGHDAGDHVLCQIAEVLTDVARDRGAACRTGGEEFVILAPGLSRDEAVALAEDIRAALGILNITYEGAALPTVTISAGVASYAVGASAQSMMRAADTALYKAKNGGRDRVVAAEDASAEKAAPQRSSAAS